MINEPIKVGNHEVIYTGSFLSEPGEDIEIRPFPGHPEWRVVFRVTIEPGADKTRNAMGPLDENSLLVEWFGSWPQGNAGASSVWLNFATFDGRQYNFRRSIHLIGNSERYTILTHLTLATIPADQS